MIDMPYKLKNHYSFLLINLLAFCYRIASYINDILVVSIILVTICIQKTILRSRTMTTIEIACVYIEKRYW